jgi:hypothetical protein
MGCIHSSVVEHNNTDENGNTIYEYNGVYYVYDSKGNFDSTYSIGGGCSYSVVDDEPVMKFEQVKPDRNDKTQTKNNVHEGLKQSLKKESFEPQGNHSIAFDHSAFDHTTMYRKHTLIENPVNTYRIGSERQTKIQKKVNMHGGLNQALKKNGHEPEGNCSDAIKKVYEKGLIDEETRDYCTHVNQNGNDGTHNWGQEKSKVKQIVDNPKFLSNPIFTYRAGPERMNKINMKNNLHGGVNQALKKKGYEPEGNFKAAVNKAHKKGLIDKQTTENCHKKNLAGNVGNHEWGQKK